MFCCIIFGLYHNSKCVTWKNSGIKKLEKEIKNLLKQPIPFIGQCLRVLLILKQNEKAGVSIPDAAKSERGDPNSVQKWKTL